MPDAAYSLVDLCDLADVTPRTVRYYIAQGLLRSPGTTGPGARYDEGHLARLRLIRRLQREHLPLAEIRARLAALTDDEAIAQAVGAAESPAGTALDYVRSVLGDRAMKPTADRPATPAQLPAGAASGVPPMSVPATPPAGPALLRRMESARLGSEIGAGPSPEADPAAPAPPPARGPATEPVVAERSQWERFVLAPDVELHVRRPLTRSQNRAVARLLETARRLLEEDQP